MKIAIIGCGNMGSGIARRLSPSHHLSLYDRNQRKVEALVCEGCGLSCSSAEVALASAEVVILAIKPQNLAEIALPLRKDQLLVSLLAGTPLSKLKRVFSEKASMVRMMPNLPLLCGEGVIGLSAVDLSSEWKKKLDTFLVPLGKVLWLPEKKIDALTSLAGSGPAFILVLIEACIEAGIAMGFDAKSSSEIVLQMCKGCLTLLEESGQHPAELKWQIASPEGTTIAGLQKLEEEAIRGTLMKTFLAAKARASELSQ